MARILVNFIYSKAKDEYKILEPDCVYADQKVAVMETEDEINIPLVVPTRNILMVVDKEKFESINKKFRLVADEKGNVLERPDGVETWLPKDTDISKLRYINNQFVMIEEQSEQEDKKPKKNG